MITPSVFWNKFRNQFKWLKTGNTISKDVLSRMPKGEIICHVLQSYCNFSSYNCIYVCRYLILLGSSLFGKTVQVFQLLLVTLSKTHLWNKMKSKKPTYWNTWFSSPLKRFLFSFRIQLMLFQKMAFHLCDTVLL